MCNIPKISFLWNNCALPSGVNPQITPNTPFFLSTPKKQTTVTTSSHCRRARNRPNPFWESLTTEILGAGCYDGFHGGRSSVVAWWEGEFGNHRALGCVSRGFNQVTKGTPALLRGGDLLQLGLGAWRGAGGPEGSHKQWGTVAVLGGCCSLQSPDCRCWQGLNSPGNGSC